MYVKEGSIIATGAKDDDAVYDYANDVTLSVYALNAGKKAETVVYNTENEVWVKAAVMNEDGNYRISVESENAYTVKLVNAGTPVSVEGADFTMDGNTPVICASGKKEIFVKF